jgi:hypothetical protein
MDRARSTVVATMAILLFSRCGDVQAALNLFDKLPPGRNSTFAPGFAHRNEP